MERHTYRDADAVRRIKALLALRGETATHLAARLGVPLNTLRACMHRQQALVGRCNIARISAALGVPASTVTEGRPWPDVRADYLVREAERWGADR